MQPAPHPSPSLCCRTIVHSEKGEIVSILICVLGFNAGLRPSMLQGLNTLMNSNLDSCSSNTIRTYIFMTLAGACPDIFYRGGTSGALTYAGVA